MQNIKKALKKEVDDASMKLGQEQHQHNKTRILYEEAKIKIENYKGKITEKDNIMKSMFTKL